MFKASCDQRQLTIKIVKDFSNVSSYYKYYYPNENYDENDPHRPEIQEIPMNTDLEKFRLLIFNFMKNLSEYSLEKSSPTINVKLINPDLICLAFRNSFEELPFCKRSLLVTLL